MKQVEFSQANIEDRSDAIFDHNHLYNDDLNGCISGDVDDEDEDDYLKEGFCKDDEGNICLENDENGKIFCLQYIERPFPFSLLLTFIKQTIDYSVNKLNDINISDDDIAYSLELLQHLTFFIENIQNKDTSFVDMDKPESLNL